MSNSTFLNHDAIEGMVKDISLVLQKHQDKATHDRRSILEVLDALALCLASVVAFIDDPEAMEFFHSVLEIAIKRIKAKGLIQ